MTTVVQQILDVLEDGPCLTSDIVFELGLPAYDAGSRLNVLYRTGRVTRRKFYIPQYEGREGGRTECWAYSLPEHAGWAA